MSFDENLPKYREPFFICSLIAALLIMFDTVEQFILRTSFSLNPPDLPFE